MTEFKFDFKRKQLAIPKIKFKKQKKKKNPFNGFAKINTREIYFFSIRENKYTRKLVHLRYIQLQSFKTKNNWVNYIVLEDAMDLKLNTSLDGMKLYFFHILMKRNYSSNFLNFHLLEQKLIHMKCLNQELNSE